LAAGRGRGQRWEFEVFPAETQPTMVMIGDAYRLWVFTCPVSADHPARTMVE
jgi:hypothetical protein